MRSLPTLQVALTRTEMRRGVLLVVKARRPIDEPLGPDLLAVAREQARAATVAEARWLVKARDPGVVALRRVEPDQARLWTGHVAVASLACSPPSPALAAQILAEVATTAGRMHAKGLVHGAIRAEHVLLTPVRSSGRGRRSLRPVLCSPDPTAAAAATGPATTSGTGGATGISGGTTTGPDVDIDAAALVALVEQWHRRAGPRRSAWDQALEALNPGPRIDPDGSGPTPTMALVAEVLHDLAERLTRRPRLPELGLAARARWASMLVELRP